MMLGPVWFWRLLILSGLAWRRRFARLRQFFPFRWRIRNRNLHRRTRLQFVLPVDHDLLTFLEAVVDQCLSCVNLGNLHRAHFGSFILRDYVGIGSVRAPLDNGSRHDQPVVPSGHQQPDIYELARPKL